MIEMLYLCLDSLKLQTYHENLITKINILNQVVQMHLTQMQLFLIF